MLDKLMIAKRVLAQLLADREAAIKNIERLERLMAKQRQEIAQLENKGK